MTAHYTVVQYVPSPVADERINFGVIAWDKKEVHSRFISNWRRVKVFGKENIDFLKEFAEAVSEQTERQYSLLDDAAKNVFDVGRIEKEIGVWSNSIQFMEARGSTKPASELINDIAPLFLRTLQKQTAPRRTRATAAALITDSLLSAANEIMPDQASDLVKRKRFVAGGHKHYRFDVVLENGAPLTAVQAISLETGDTDNIQREIESVFYEFYDVRNKYSSLPLGLFVIGRKKHQSIYRTAKAMAVDFRAEVIPEGNAKSWSAKITQEVLN